MLPVELVIRQRNGHGQDIAGFKPGINPQEPRRAPEQQAGAHQEHDCQRNLRGHEHTDRPVVLAAGALAPGVQEGRRCTCARHPRRHEPGETAGRDRNHHGEDENEPVNAGVADQRHLGRKPWRQQPGGYRHEDNARCRRDERDEQGFNQHLSRDPEAARAEGRTNREVTLAYESAGQQEGGHVAAGDHEHQSGRQQQPQHHTPRSAEDLGPQWNDLHPPVPVGTWESRCERSRHDVDLSLRLFDRDARSQLRDHIDRAVIAPGILSEGERQPEVDLILHISDCHLRHRPTVEVGGERREMHVHRHDTQYQMRRRTGAAQVDHVHVEHGPDDGSIGGEAPRPESAAEDDAVGPLIPRTENAAVD